MIFYISFFIIAVTSILLIVVSCKKIFGKKRDGKIVMLPRNAGVEFGCILLLIAVGVMILKAVYAREEGIDGALVGGWFVFALALMSIYSGFRHKIFVGAEIVIKPLLGSAKRIEWSDIDFVKIRHDRLFLSRTSGVDIIKVFSHGKKVFAVNEEYFNYDSFLIALTENKIKIDDYKD